jgi:hypothetical protein
MFEPYNPPLPLAANDLTRPCEHCGEAIEVDEPCIDLFYGVLGRGKRGFLMVVDATSTPEPSVLLHQTCVVSWCLDNIDDALPESLKDEKCSHCGFPVDLSRCPRCGGNLDE